MVSDKERFIEFLNLALDKKINFQKQGFLYGTFINERLIHINLHNDFKPVLPDMISEFTALESF